MKSKKYPSQAELKELFDYNPETGDLIWRNKTSNKSAVKIGDIAGSLEKNGYIIIKINKTAYKAHRLVWIWNNGIIPVGYEIDHIDGVRNNNRYYHPNNYLSFKSNLRLATRSQNQCNSLPKKNNLTGVKGLCELVDKKSGKKYWACEVEINRFTNRCRKRKNFPFTESTKESQKAVAIAWLERTRAELHGEFTNHGTSHDPCLKSPTP